MEDQRSYFEEKLENCKKAFEETEEMKGLKGKLDLIMKGIADGKARRKKVRKENHALEKQNEFLRAKVDESLKDQELNNAIRQNLAKQLEQPPVPEEIKGEEEARVGAEIDRKVQIVEELQKEVAALYALIT